MLSSANTPFPLKSNFRGRRGEAPTRVPYLRRVPHRTRYAFAHTNRRLSHPSVAQKKAHALRRRTRGNSTTTMPLLRNMRLVSLLFGIVIVSTEANRYEKLGVLALDGSVAPPPDSIPPGAPAVDHADRVNLSPFYDNLTRSIRRVASQAEFAIAYEPSWPVGTQDLEPDAKLPSTGL